MLNNRQLFLLIILLELLVSSYIARKIDQDENLFEEKHANSKKTQKIVPLNRVEHFQSKNTERNILSTATKWPGGLVPYEISAAFSEDRKNMIREAMTTITEKTNRCITFTPRSTHSNWILIQRGTG
jgi:hypothetical protein